VFYSDRRTGQNLNIARARYENENLQRRDKSVSAEKKRLYPPIANIEEKI